MKVTSVSALTINEGNLVAYADITIDNCFCVRDLKIFRRPPGYVVANASGETRRWHVSRDRLCDQC
jgi:DNA-binding cell septation regulator SpoVG